MADTAEQIQYDKDLAALQAMPEGSPARLRAKEDFDAKYPTGRPGMDAAAKAAAAETAGKAFGFMKQFIDANPTDENLKKAWALLLENDVAGAKLAFQASNYYANTGTVADKRLKDKLARFGVYSQEFSQWADEQVRRLVGNGIQLNLSDPKVKNLLEASYLSADSDNQIDIKALSFNNGKPLGGTTGGSIAELRSYAKAFGMNYGDAAFQKWSQDIFAGKTTGFDIQNQIRQDAASAFPMYADKIIAGTSLDSLGSAYRSSMATILEVDGDSVDWGDTMLRQALQYTVDGKPAVMPIWEFEQKLRSDARWQFTNNARDTIDSLQYKVMKDWGLM